MLSARLSRAALLQVHTITAFIRLKIGPSATLRRTRSRAAGHNPACGEKSKPLAKLGAKGIAAIVHRRRLPAQGAYNVDCFT